MDEHVSMEGPGWVQVSGYGPIPVPQTIEEWLDPQAFVGLSINWYMAQNDSYMKQVPQKMINEFYYSEEHRQVFEHLVQVTTGSEYLNLLCNACHRITHDDHQQWLMTVMNHKGQPAAEFMINDMRKNTAEDIHLRKLRTTIWQLIR
jgi:hypothetical protein